MVEKQPEMRAKLEQGWQWMQRNPGHSGLDDFYNDKFLPLMRQYEQAYGFADKKDEQMAFDLPIDAKPKERLQS